MIDNIAEAIENHEQSLRQIWRLIGKARNSKTLSEGEKEERLRKLYSALSVKDVRENFVVDGSRYDIGVSFRSSMTNMMRTKKRLRAIGYNIASGSNNKTLDRAFGERMGVPTPKELARDVATADVIVQPGTIIKPMRGAGSRGVFYVRPDGALLSVKSQAVYGGLHDAESEYTTLIKPGRPMTWMVEEAVVGPDGGLARDMKAFMFYGEAVIYREIVRGAQGAGPAGNLFANYDSEGRPIHFRPRDNELEGRGVPEVVRKYVETLSLAVPTPFLRIDMLVGAHDCYLGEITPHPGGTYAGDLYDDVDKLMGAKFHEAEARLFVDMFEGKRFSDYFEVYGSIRQARQL